MACTSDRELQSLYDQLHEAWTADVPNLVEIQKCRERIYEYLALCVIDGKDQANQNEGVTQTNLRVIENDSPILSAPKGICSPIKTDEIRRFEDLARNVFGNIESCETTW